MFFVRIFSSLGTNLTTLSATDPEGNPITFSIDIKEFFSLVPVDPNTVRVVHTSNIDYETRNEIKFKVTAKDDVSNSKVSTEYKHENTTLSLYVQLAQLCDFINDY